MGTSYLQHRVAIGSFNCSGGMRLLCGSSHGNLDVFLLIIRKLFSNKEAGNVWFTILLCFMCVFYMYMLCLTLALTVDISGSDFHEKTSLLSHYPHYNHVFNSTNPKTFVDYIILFFVELWIYSRNFKIKYAIKKLKNYNNRCSTLYKVSHMYTLWLVTINIFLIIIANPAIVNPGPSKNANCPNISVLLQNVRGLIPFTDLGKPSPKLDNTKLFELQAYVFHNKTDIVILNETWLTNDILNNEIFPNNTYKTFWVDRSMLTHPPLILIILINLKEMVVVYS